MNLSPQDPNRRLMRKKTEASANEPPSPQVSKITQHEQMCYGRSPGVIPNQFSEGLVNRVMRWSKHAHFPHSPQQRKRPWQTFSELFYPQNFARGASENSVDQPTITQPIGYISRKKLPIQHEVTSAERLSNQGQSLPILTHNERSVPSPLTPASTLPRSQQSTLISNRIPSTFSSRPILTSSIVQRYLNTPTHSIGQTQPIQSTGNISSLQLALAQNRDSSSSISLGGSIGTEHLSQKRFRLQRKSVNINSTAVRPVSRPGSNNSPNLTLLTQIDTTKPINRAVSKIKPNKGLIQHKVSQHSNQPVGISYSGLDVLLRKQYLPKFSSRNMLDPSTSVYLSHPVTTARFGQLNSLPTQSALHRQVFTDASDVLPIHGSNRDNLYNPASPSPLPSTSTDFGTVKQQELNDKSIQRKISVPVNQVIKANDSGLDVVQQRQHIQALGWQTTQPISSNVREFTDNIPENKFVQRMVSKFVNLPVGTSRPNLGVNLQKQHKPVVNRVAVPTIQKNNKIDKLPSNQPIFESRIKRVSDGPGYFSDQSAPEQITHMSHRSTKPTGERLVQVTTATNKSVPPASTSRTTSALPLVTPTIPNSRPVQLKKSVPANQPITGSGLDILHQKPFTNQAPPKLLHDQNDTVKIASTKQFVNMKTAVPIARRVIKSSISTKQTKRSTAKSGIPLPSSTWLMRHKSTPYQSMIQASTQINAPYPPIQAAQTYRMPGIARPTSTNVLTHYVQRWPNFEAGNPASQTATLTDLPLVNVTQRQAAISNHTSQSAAPGTQWFGSDSGISSVTAVQRATANSSTPSSANNMPETGTESASMARLSNIQSNMNDLELERIANMVYQIIEQRLIFERESMGL